MICYLFSVALGDACRLQEGERKGHVQEERRRAGGPLYVRLISSAKSLSERTGVCNLLKWSENVCLQHFFWLETHNSNNSCMTTFGYMKWQRWVKDEVECWLSVCWRGLFLNVLLIIDCCVLACKNKDFHVSQFDLRLGNYGFILHLIHVFGWWDGTGNGASPDSRLFVSRLAGWEWDGSMEPSRRDIRCRCRLNLSLQNSPLLAVFSVSSLQDLSGGRA